MTLCGKRKARPDSGGKGAGEGRKGESERVSGHDAQQTDTEQAYSRFPGRKLPSALPNVSALATLTGKKKPYRAVGLGSGQEAG